MEKVSKVGQIINDVWGYSMTLVDFYKIVRETEKSVWIQKVGSKTVSVEGYLAGRCVPTDSVVEEKIHRLKKDNVDEKGRMWYRGSLDYGSVHTLRDHDGQPVYFNHCD